jgi:4-alpha-glucanotransferase/alpha-amylase
MPHRIALLFGVHAHQPGGNFPEVFELARTRCYRPFLETLHGFPQFRFALHFSGPLLDYLSAHHAEDMALLAEMVSRGQVELFGAGDAEPVLASIPARDRVGQLNRLSAKLETRFGNRPQGAWLTERVWESTVVPSLAECGMRYATVDDYHFLCAGKGAGELDGYFTTEEDGRRLDLFPISEKLRYCIPFAPAEDAVGAIEKLAQEGHECAIYFDDIEKFGVWPDTFDWVYGGNWLRRFVSGVLASEHIATQTYGEFHAGHRTRGIVYLPTTSYIEMNEWTLPAPAAQAFAELVRDEKQRGTYERHKAYLRGGIWKNFLARYPEANWIHKRMLSLSARLAALPPSAADPAAVSEMHTLLFAAQANDAYWHGLFGGLYLPHLRRALYRALVRLEALLDRAAPRPPSLQEDIDCDGHDELFLHSDELQAVVRLDGYASLCELDAYALEHNFGDTLRRHAEHYHRRILAGWTPPKHSSGIASAHERFGVKHVIAAADLQLDAHARSLFIDTWIAASGETRVLHEYAPDPEQRDGVPERRFSARVGDALISKSIAVRGAGVAVGYRVETGQAACLQVELDLAMPSCDGFTGRYVHRDEIIGGFGESFELENADRLVLDDRHLAGSVALSCSRPAKLLARPCLTVSQSEDGFERIMQSVSITLQFGIEPGNSDISVTLEIGANPGLAAATAGIAETATHEDH